jgi:membrane associated rhomboid family serine protease
VFCFVPVQVGHIAHLGGALAGVLLVWLLSKLPDPDAKSS